MKSEKSNIKPMATISEHRVIKKHCFNELFLDVGPNPMVIEKTQHGFDLKTMGGTTALKCVDMNDGKGLQFEAAQGMYGRVFQHNPLSAPSYSDETKMLQSDFEPLAGNDELAKDLLRLKKG